MYNLLINVFDKRIIWNPPDKINTNPITKLRLQLSFYEICAEISFFFFFSILISIHFIDGSVILKQLLQVIIWKASPQLKFINGNVKKHSIRLQLAAETK